MEELRSARKEEYDELTKFLELSYGLPQGFFQQHYPQLYREDTINLNNNLLLVVDNEIVSHVGVYPLHVIIKDKVISAGGVGGVATHPAHRGKGYMSKLLNFSIERMKNEGYNISVLWGDRQRYRNFGYECAGQQINFVITMRSLEKAKVGLFCEGIRIKKYEGSREDLEKIILLHESEPLRVKRDRRTYALLLKKAGVNIWLGEKDKDVAYLISSGDLIIESGGEPLTFVSLMYKIMKCFNIPSFTVVRPCIVSEINKMLYEVSLSQSTISEFVMLKIINLEDTVRILCSGREVREKDEKITLKIKGNGEYATLVFDGKITVSKEYTDRVIELKETDMVRLIFGLLPASRWLPLEPKALYLLDYIFPVDFFIWPLDYV
jgi:predicted acetyltransferase